MSIAENEPEAPRRIRAMLINGMCKFCDEHRDDRMMPPHDASPRCESGKRHHCTCDTCF
jgi:hypothetical protein